MLPTHPPCTGLASGEGCVQPGAPSSWACAPLPPPPLPGVQDVRSDPTLPRTKDVTCPVCTNSEAVFFTSSTEQGERGVGWQRKWQRRTGRAQARSGQQAGRAAELRTSPTGQRGARRYRRSCLNAMRATRRRHAQLNCLFCRPSRSLCTTGQAWSCSSRASHAGTDGATTCSGGAEAVARGPLHSACASSAARPPLSAACAAPAPLCRALACTGRHTGLRLWRPMVSGAARPPSPPPHPRRLSTHMPAAASVACCCPHPAGQASRCSTTHPTAPPSCPRTAAASSTLLTLPASYCLTAVKSF